MCESIISRCHWNTISLVVAAQNFYDLAFFFPFFRLNEPILFGGRRNRGDHTHNKNCRIHSVENYSPSIHIRKKTNEQKNTEKPSLILLSVVFFSLSYGIRVCEACNLGSFFSQHFWSMHEHCTNGAGRLATKQNIDNTHISMECVVMNLQQASTRTNRLTSPQYET